MPALPLVHPPGLLEDADAFEHQIAALRDVASCTVADLTRHRHDRRPRRPMRSSRHRPALRARRTFHGRLRRARDPAPGARSAPRASRCSIPMRVPTPRNPPRTGGASWRSPKRDFPAVSRAAHAPPRRRPPPRRRRHHRDDRRDGARHRRGSVPAPGKRHHRPHRQPAAPRTDTLQDPGGRRAGRRADAAGSAGGAGRAASPARRSRSSRIAATWLRWSGPAKWPSCSAHGSKDRLHTPKEKQHEHEPRPGAGPADLPPRGHPDPHHPAAAELHRRGLSDRDRAGRPLRRRATSDTVARRQPSPPSPCSRRASSVSWSRSSTPFPTATRSRSTRWFPAPTRRRAATR